MPKDIAVHCECGQLRGVARDVSPRAGIRCVCYCDDCQAYAAALRTRDRILDGNGGTDIFQMSPARLQFTQGTDVLACLRVTPRGGYRWYTRCCETAIGNTPPTGRVPFVGLIHTCLDAEDGRLDDILGPPRVRIMARFAKGRLPTFDAHPGFSPGHLASMLGRIAYWRLRGDHRRSPLFDPASGEPIAAPESLADARAHLAAGPAPGAAP